MVAQEVNDKELIHIVTAIDEEYLQHLYVMFTSLIKNTDLRKVKIVLHVIHQTINEVELVKLKEFFETNSIRIHEYKIKIDNMNHFHTSGHINITTYYRILIPSLLSSRIKKVIYLDSDMVICDDICELWSFDIMNQAIGAIADMQGNDRKNELGIPQTSLYFNAGVLLMNLELWRDNMLATKVIEYIKYNPEKLKYWDQDALNSVLYDSCLYLPNRWNVQSNAYFRKSRDNIIVDSLMSPSIIHFTTGSKPWHLTNEHPLKEQYEYYLRMTPFKNDTLVKEATLSIISNKDKIFIFGAGEQGRKVAELLGITGLINGYIDNDPTKKGTKLASKKVYSLKELGEFDMSDVGIIVTSSHFRSISNQLKELKLIENIDFVHQM